MAELNLWLDSYDDIYSDFDSRNYRKRRISEDFVEELKTSLKYDRQLTDQLILRVPAKLRNEEMEKEIVSSIKRQFKDREEVLDEKARTWRKRGRLFVITGFLAMLLNSGVAFKVPGGYFPTLTRIILEPAGWFLIWTGLDFLLYEYRAKVREIDFYEVVGAMQIGFKDE